MSDPIDPVELLTLDAIGPGRFRNRRNQPNSYHVLFGGQVVAQALAAADRTVPDKTIHSLHAYFLRAGNSELPVDYAVEVLRDGSRFSARRVCALQEDRLLFTMECSYRADLPGVSHQTPCPAPSMPATALNPAELAASGRADIARYTTLFSGRFPIEVRMPQETGFFAPGPAPARHYWLRAPGMAGCDDPALHRQMMAFLSDFMVSGAPLVPHTVALPGPHIFVASLDHAVWYHRPVRCDDWLLFVTDSPSAENGVNLSRCQIYDPAGVLVASVAQESFQIVNDEANG